MKNILLCSALLFSAVVAFAQDPTYKFQTKISLPGDGKWDYLKMDGEKERLFVSHFDRVHVIDLTTNKPIGEITGLNGVHGIALAKDLEKGYISNGADNKITIFDYNTFKVLKTLQVEGKKADAIMYDSPSKQIFVFNNGSGTAVVINAQTDQVVGTIDVGGAPEFAVSDGKGTVYNNNEDTHEVTVIDAKTLKVKGHYPLAPNKVATGLAMDVENNRLFSGCRDPKTLVVVDAATGKIIQTLPIGGGVDAVIYDKELKVIMTSNGEGNVTVIKQETPDKYKVIQTLVTKPGQKTMVHRGTTHNIYLSGAEYKEDGKTLKPGTFGVYVYSMK
ncbi:MAG: YncE family protein [Bacteroidota bacterium]